MSQTEICQKVSKPEDLDLLRALCRQVIGQECWSAHTRCDWVLALEMGMKIPISTPNKVLAERMQQGSWAVDIHSSEWVIQDKFGQIYCSPHSDLREIKSLVRVLESACVTHIDVSYPSLGLHVAFDKGYQLIIATCEDDTGDGRSDIMQQEEVSDIPCWMLFMPNDMVVEVGPGTRQWRYIRSDTPIS